MLRPNFPPQKINGQHQQKAFFKTETMYEIVLFLFIHNEHRKMNIRKHSTALSQYRSEEAEIKAAMEKDRGMPSFFMAQDTNTIIRNSSYKYIIFLYFSKSIRQERGNLLSYLHRCSFKKDIISPLSAGNSRSHHPISRRQRCQAWPE